MMMDREAEERLFSLARIGAAIHQLNRNSERRLGLSLVQWCLLKRLIDLPGAPAQALAAAVGVHPSTLTQTLKRLQRKGLIHVAEDPKDSRKKVIAITRAGRDALWGTGARMAEMAQTCYTLSPCSTN